MERRTFVQSIMGMSVLGGIWSAKSSGMAAPSFLHETVRKTHVAVVGAGAFGGWAALHLLRKGAQVTLLDAWGPGNSRASSGGETRVIRHAYTHRIYVHLVARSMETWMRTADELGEPLFFPTGVLFMAPDDTWIGPAHRHMEEAGIDHEILDGKEIKRRFPALNVEGLNLATYERSTGYLLARRACAAVVRKFVREGGTYKTVSVQPGETTGDTLSRVRLSDGSTLQADQYVFACGPWLGKMFPETVGKYINPTRQEVFYFGMPAGDGTFSDEQFPVWADMGNPVWYGIPGNEHRGFKIADDSRGVEFDPTNGERLPSEAALKAARDYVSYRFPALKGAPLLESRVCQYEQTPDGHFIVDRHPAFANVWLVGGGSGHGYKLGPALGEMAAGNVLEQRPIEPLFSLARFVRP